MSHDAFDAKILAEKLSKLNNSQQSIESLSRWCISHRKKARQIVETWEKLFNASQKDHCIVLLYLANDILQNSRRKGSEFVNEFWKVLPAALKHVYTNGDENGKRAVSRLVDIWEERKVFGSKVENLKDEMLAKDTPSQLVSGGKSSNPIKIVKKDAQSLRIKLAVGGLAEKIVTAFHSVHDECSNEEAALVKCNAALHCMQRIEKDIENYADQGIQIDSSIAVELQEQGTVLEQCVKQLECAEAARASLVSQLKDALQDQESKLEVIRSQLQVARNRTMESRDLRPNPSAKLNSGTMTASMNSTEPAPSGHNKRAVQETITLPLTQNHRMTASRPSVDQLQQPPNQLVTTFSSLVASEEDKKKSTAAAVAAKLAASTSSAQMLTSILSSLAAEEAASSNGNLVQNGFASSVPMPSPEKRAKVELSAMGTSGSDMGSQAYFTRFQQPLNNVSSPSASAGPLPMSPADQIQASLPLSHTHPPPMNTQGSQFVQSAGMMLRPMPFGYNGGNLPPPPPPLPSHVATSLARPPAQQQQQQQQSPTGGFYRASGVGPYGHNQPPPPVYHQ